MYFELVICAKSGQGQIMGELSLEHAVLESAAELHLHIISSPYRLSSGRRPRVQPCSAAQTVSFPINIDISPRPRRTSTSRTPRLGCDAARVLCEAGSGHGPLPIPHGLFIGDRQMHQ